MNIIAPTRLADDKASLDPLRSVQFSSVTLDARGCLAWTSLGIISFLRSLYSKFSSVQFSSLAQHSGTRVLRAAHGNPYH